MRIAVLGTGLMAGVRTRQVLADDRVTWVGVASSSVDRARKLASDLSASQAGSIEEMLDRPLDAVMITGSSEDRAAHIRLALVKGVPIFCEKPLATDLDDCRAVVVEANEAGVEIQVGFQRRFDAELAAVKNQIVDGHLGRLYSINLTSHDHEPPPEQFVATSGGLFSDLGVHDYDLARWLTGEEVAEVYATGAFQTEWKYFERYEDPDTAVTVLRMESGLPIVVSTSRHSPDGHDVRAEVFGASHNVTIGHGDYAPLRGPAELEAGKGIAAFPNFFARFEDAFLRQTAAFVDWVSGEGSNPCSADEGLQSLRIASAANRSWKENRPISLSEV